MNIKTSQAKPFIKWVGGKTQLLTQLEEQLPERIYNRPFTYIEPFVGGGAMLFFMLRNFPCMRKVVINDINENLVKAYKTIRDRPRDLISRLKSIEEEYFSIEGEERRKEFFLLQRLAFNKQKLDDVENTKILMFLNRTCFNGLYRVNSKGEFNVPFGRYAHPTICNADTILADSKVLNEKQLVLLHGDYAQIEEYIEPQQLTFIYFDPPYRPLSATSSFNSYAKDEFGDMQQTRLGYFCAQVSSHNCLWMLSNSDCSAKNPNDRFFEELYDDFFVERVYASRSVNAISSKRGRLTELLIRNYQQTIGLYNKQMRIEKHESSAYRPTV